LLRQYFPKNADLAGYPADHLDAVAAQLNGRPCKTLGFKTPAEVLAKLLSDDQAAVLRRPVESAVQSVRRQRSLT
jgi:IS30 family transposase